MPQTQSKTAVHHGKVIRIKSPEICRSPLTGKYIVVTKEQREAQKRRAKELGLGWYV